jgi:RimJ/RimL family protein N-acetyltransferase
MKLPNVIQTKRLIIRPFQNEDLRPYLAFMTDELATQYMLFTQEQKTEKGAKELFKLIVNSYSSDHPVFAYAIALSGNGFIGSCGISKLNQVGVYECYYSLLPEYWHRGYATEATNALLDYCFQHYPIKAIKAYMNPANVGSARVAERLGMAYLGLHRHPTFKREGKVYSITKAMWDSAQPRPIASKAL